MFAERNMLYLHAHAHALQPLRVLENDVKCSVTSLRRKLELVKLKIPFSVDTKRS